MTKLCSTCKETKDEACFEKDMRYKTGLRSQCNDCRYGNQKRTRLKGHLKRTYGLDIEDYDRMILEQGGKCAICDRDCVRKKRVGETRTFQREGWTRVSVDHDHRTGLVRGLLCNTCNVGIGSFKDDSDLLIKAANYLGYQQ